MFNDKTMIVTLYRLYFLGLYALYLVSFGLFLLNVSPDFTFNFTTLVFPAVELSVFYGIGRLLLSLRQRGIALVAKGLALLFPMALTLVYVFQGASAWMSGQYLTVLALENIADIGYAADLGLAALLLAVILLPWMVLSCLVLQPARSVAERPLGKVFFAGFAVSALLFVGMVDSSSRPRPFFRLQPDMSPGTALGRRVLQVYTDSNEIKDTGEALRRAGMRFGGSKEFPLQKSTVYHNELPFSKRADAGAPRNVIVIFVEGFSARWTQTYGGRFDDLMPEFDAFAKQAMVVDNYYNHTAATYRGIKGQLVSGYPRRGGNETGGWTAAGEDNSKALMSLNYQSLPFILKDKGYETAFFSPERKSSPFGPYLHGLGFDDVFDYSTILPYLNSDQADIERQKKDEQISDKGLFMAVENWMRKKAIAGNKKPFFLGMYSGGTHAFSDSGPSGAKYGGGGNSALNRFRNLDEQLGGFLDYFLASQYSKNTLLVLTTDHATYPEPPVVAALDAPGYQRLFVDKIPLVIFDNALDLPAKFDAKLRTSIDFAPSILHLLSIKDAENAFLGTSLFEAPLDYQRAMTAIGSEFFALDTDKIRPLPAKNSGDAKTVNYRNLIRYYYYLESNNRIFDPKP